MRNREDAALAADLELARQFGLKGFAETSDPTSTAAASTEHLVPDDASEDLALARAFGLKGFTNEPLTVAPANVSPSTPAPAQSGETNDASADLALAGKFGLKGFETEAKSRYESSSRVFGGLTTATPDTTGGDSAPPPPRVAKASTSAAPASSTAHRSKSPAREEFLRVCGSPAALNSLEMQLGRPLATVVRGKKSYHSRLGPDGSETRLLSIPSGGIIGLDSVLGEIAPGVRASVERADLSSFRAVGSPTLKPAQIQPDLVAALAKAAAK